ncbi:plasmid pRiA4b ORF-3 family protein [Clostridium sp. Marseille-Q2269]|uniref:plasmid pRiA4b ORF-3 family protein n=1 Tax=Clostridium sp. Marseille-Q2269 TaxID=2942205 RepID=UPI002073717A|nr:plasmid pRiA4b ORF-3 family protein [Clostridium sp. Marseille-Q2269]
MKGKCYFCNKEFSKSGVLRHIKSCSDMREYMGENIKSSKVKKDKFILNIASKYNPSIYWLYIAINKTATLKDLDKFLRDVWVECCGHLSSFKINNNTYESEIDSIFGSEAKDMNVKLKDVVTVNDKINYEYDFGSTTYLTIKVEGELSSLKTEKQIEIMARNNEPEIKCCNCDNKASYYDGEYDEFLCEECYNKSNREDSEMIDKIDYWNSPRDGVCGYYGEKSDETPYVPLINKRI